MILTRNFSESILARIERDPAFGEELLHATVECLRFGDVDTGRVVLSQYVDATTDGQELGASTSVSEANTSPQKSSPHFQKK